MYTTKLVQGRNDNVKRFPMETADYTGFAEIRYNDHCKNGHNDFAITGDFWDKSRRYKDPQNPDTGGCCHDLIMEAVKGTEQEKFFSDAIKFHLVSTDGPMHYYANTMYHAKYEKAGIPNRWNSHIKFGNFPIVFSFKEKSFMKKLFSMSKMDFHNVKIEAVKHREEKGGYKYNDHYTFSCFPVKEWYQAPFSTKGSALEFLSACKKYKIKRVEKPCGWTDGKEANKKVAQNSAIWPGATLAQLRSREALENHLIDVMKDFHNFIVNDCKFEY